jgi:AraC family transcriptional regulator
MSLIEQPVKTAAGGARVDPLAFIERRLFEPLTLGVVAEACGLSPFHFSRLFTAAYGQSVMAYVRARRLHVAAERLLFEPKLKLVELAFDCGFESQEAFTRAFARAFGVTPGRFRRGGYLLNPGDRPMSETLDVARSLVQMGEAKQKPRFVAAGFGGRFGQSNRSGIPALWPKLTATLPLTGQVGRETYGLCWSQDPAEGSFNYLAGVQVAKDAAIPDGMERLEVPAQTYLTYRLTLTGADLHPQMVAAAMEIWGGRLAGAGFKPSGGPDFEFYPADFDPAKPGAWVEFWVPVQA